MTYWSVEAERIIDYICRRMNFAAARGVEKSSKDNLLFFYEALNDQEKNNRSNKLGCNHIKTWLWYFY
jgi:hypothetical protein